MYRTRTESASLWVATSLMAATFCASPALAQQESSHLVVPASRINQLTDRTDLGGNCSRFGEFSTPFFMVRLKANGDENTSPFIVPAGKNFVITDVVWSVRTRRTEGGFIDPGSMEISIETYNESTPSVKRVVSSLPFVIIPSDIGPRPLGGSHRFTSGVRIPAGHGICVRADAWQLRASSSFRSSENIYQAHVQGYLIKTP